MNDEYTELANAIVIQAVKDWQKAVRTLKKHPRYHPALLTREECERFFLGEWFMQLTNVDGRMIYMSSKLCRQSGALHRKSMKRYASVLIEANGVSHL